ncbi:hypothetical protein MRX96_031090 [Rhipicephalus microplus]
MCRTIAEYVAKRLTVAAQLLSSVHPNGTRGPKCDVERQRERTMRAPPLSLSTAGAPFLFALSETLRVPRAARVPPSYGLWKRTRACLFGHAGPCFARQRDASRIGALKHEGHPL